MFCYRSLNWLALNVRSCCSVAQWCLTFCGPMDCSTPGSLFLHYLLEFAQTHVHGVKWCHPIISSSITPFSSCPQSFPVSEPFLMSWFFASDGQRIEASATASVFPMNTQDWFTLELTVLISLQSKGLSGDFSNTTVWTDKFFITYPSLWSNSHIHTWLLEKSWLSCPIWQVWLDFQYSHLLELCNDREKQCQRMLKLPHTCTHLPR